MTFSFFKRWLLIFLLLIGSSALVIVPLLERDEQHLINAVRVSGHGQLDTSANLLQETIRQLQGDAHVIANAPATLEFLAQGRDDHNVAKLFHSFCQTYGRYDQIRLLSASGMELVRVNHNGGACEKTPQDALQSKSGRNYFEQAVTLAAGEFYVSPMDYNIEHGKLEIPYKPMIRVSTPVREEGQSLRAVVVMNYSAGDLLGKLYADESVAGSESAQTFLLNRDGFYLLRQDVPEHAFGFATGHDEYNLRDDDALTWQRLQQGEHSYRSARGLYLFKAVRLQALQVGHAAADRPAATASAPDYYLVRFVPNAVLFEASSIHGAGKVYWTAGYLVLIALLSGLLAMLGLRRQAQSQERRRSARELQEIIDASPYGVVVYDEAQQCIHKNAMYWRILDLPPAFRGDASFAFKDQIRVCYARGDYGVAKTEQAILSELAERMQNRQPYAAQRRIGSGQWIDVHGTPLSEGRYMFSYSDVTDFKQANERLEAAASAAVVGVWDWDLVRNEMYWDDVMYKLYALRKEDSGSAYEARTRSLHPEDRAAAEQAVQDALESKRAFGSEFRIVWPDGSIHYIKASGKVTYDEAGKPVHFIGMNFDITPTKQLENQLRAALVDQEVILNSETAGFWITKNRNTTWLNNIAAHRLGYEPEELIGKSTRMLYLDDAHYAQFGDLRHHAFSEGRVLHTQYQWRCKDGTLRWFDITGMPMPSDQASTIWSIIDIEEIKQSEQLLLEAKAHAEQANAAKSAFLAAMSHEIRTPLNVVIGTTYLLGHTALDEGQRRDLRTIEVSSKNLLALINDVLDFSKIEAGELSIDSHLFVLSDLLNDLRAMFSVLAEDKKLALTIEALGPDIPSILIGDSGRLNQILINLLGNALKFTERGSVQLKVSETGRDAIEQVVWLRMEVTDTGIGIAPEVQKKLFQAFIQGDGSTSRQYGGTGLGLCIVRQLAELMGGVVGLESEPGRGSTFWVELPFRISEMDDKAMPEEVSSSKPPETAAALQSHSLHGLRVMIVDDSTINLRVLHRIISAAGAFPDTCESGSEAIAALEASPEDFDVVLMDLQMPGIDGVETTRRIRELPRFASLPIIALTAGATGSQQQKAMAAGMNDFMTKPVDPAQLIAVLRQYGRKAHAAIAAAPAEPDQAAGASPETMPGAERWPEIEGVDSALAMTLMQRDLALFVDLMRMMLEQNQNAAQEIRALIDAGDLPQAAKRAHKVRGQAAAIAATALQQVAGNLENSILAQDVAMEAQFSRFQAVHAALINAASAWLNSKHS